MRLRRSLGAAAVLAGLVATSLAPTALATPDSPATPPPFDPCAPELACGTDLEWMQSLEQKMNDHLVWGQAVELAYNTAERVPGDIQDVYAWGDSGLWTGTYLAAQSFRYATAKKHLSGPAPHLDEAEVAFWTAQRDEALTRVRLMVDKYHLLTNIAADWQTEFAPSTNPPSFGGGVIKGEPGMLMRACAPTDAPANLDMAPNKRVFGPFDWKDGKQYVCETAPSRDTYAGTTFGLLAAFDLVAADHPEMQSQIRGDILTLASFLVKYGWNYPRPHGNISAPPNGHDFDNFASPLFVYVPLARLNLTQAARHVADVAGSDQEKATWNAIWAEELASQGPLLAGSMEVDAVQPNDGYYKYNLHHLTGYNLVRLERDPSARALFMQALGVMDRTTGDDVNAHFETITWALTGETARRDLALTHLREWTAYRTRIDTGAPTRNDVRCGVDIECVPRDQLEVVVEGADPVVVPGTQTALRARGPLAVADRPPTDFLWQRPPTQLNGDHPATHEAPGIDYLLPYWMLRYHAEVARPELSPFPPYPGPAHR